MRIILAVLVFMAVTACSSELAKPGAPDDLIPQDTMVLIMRRLVVLEAHIDATYQNVRYYSKLARKTGDRTLKDFHVSPERFERSYDYYVSRQEQLQQIYTIVLDSLNKEVNELNAKGIKAEPTENGQPNLIQPFK